MEGIFSLIFKAISFVGLHCGPTISIIMQMSPNHLKMLFIIAMSRVFPLPTLQLVVTWEALNKDLSRLAPSV